MYIYIYKIVILDDRQYTSWVLYLIHLRRATDSARLPHGFRTKGTKVFQRRIVEGDHGSYGMLGPGAEKAMENQKIHRKK